MTVNCTNSTTNDEVAFLEAFAKAANDWQYTGLLTLLGVWELWQLVCSDWRIETAAIEVRAHLNMISGSCLISRRRELVLIVWGSRWHGDTTPRYRRVMRMEHPKQTKMLPGHPDYGAQANLETSFDIVEALGWGEQ